MAETMQPVEPAWSAESPESQAEELYPSPPSLAIRSKFEEFQASITTDFAESPESPAVGLHPTINSQPEVVQHPITAGVTGAPESLAAELPLLFEYEPLDASIDSLRILIVEPAAKNEDSEIIRCELCRVTFSERPIYTALSYTWGNSKDGKFIYINGKRFFARENLYRALIALRKNRYERSTVGRLCLWVDAVCIDQSNMEERKEQVRLMDYIYTRANYVMIWLGELPSSLQAKLDRSSLIKVRPKRKTKEQEDEEQRKEKHILLWVYTNEYWRRLWIIQEVALARGLIVSIGGVCWAWEDFLRLLERSKIASYERRGHRIKILDEKRRNRHTTSNILENLLADFLYARCQEPRDKIYGLLGLAHDCEDGSLEADYSKPLFEVHFDVVNHLNQRRLFAKGYPSAADRAMRIVRFSDLVHCALGPGAYQPDFSCDADPGKFCSIVVRAIGCVGGQILRLGPTYGEMISSSAANKKWRSSFSNFYPTPEDTEKLRKANEIYMQVILGSSVPVNESRWTYDPTKFYSKAIPANGSWTNNEGEWEQTLTSVDVVGPPTQTDFVPDDSSPWPPPREPRMFLATNYHFGLAPHGVEEGDFICQFWKTKVTALLRKVEDMDVFRVVGRVNLHLQNEAERWNQPKDGGDILLVDMDMRTLNLLTYNEQILLS